MAKSSYYTPRCMAFKSAFKDMPGVTTFEHELVTYDGQCTDFGTNGIIVSCKMLKQKMIHIARTTSIETAQKKRWMTC